MPPPIYVENRNLELRTPPKNASNPGRREQRPETALPGQSTGAYIICPKVFRPNR